MAQVDGGPEGSSPIVAAHFPRKLAGALTLDELFYCVALTYEAQRDRDGRSGNGLFDSVHDRESRPRAGGVSTCVESHGMNLYEYARSQPVQSVDPFGTTCGHCCSLAFDYINGPPNGSILTGGECFANMSPAEVKQELLKCMRNHILKDINWKAQCSADPKEACHNDALKCCFDRVEVYYPQYLAFYPSCTTAKGCPFTMTVPQTQLKVTERSGCCQYKFEMCSFRLPGIGDPIDLIPILVTPR
jgi:hypothetical protein